MILSAAVDGRQRTFLAGHCSADIFGRLELKFRARAQNLKEKWTVDTVVDLVKVDKSALDKLRATFRNDEGDGPFFVVGTLYIFR